MNGEEDRIEPIEKGLAAHMTETSLRLEVTDLLLCGLRDVHVGRFTLEQGDVLQKIEAALEAYRNFFYPPEQR